jgi:2-dehydro-3-deoxy-D-arabinonate dehydratase
MKLTRHQTPAGPRWAVDGRALPATFSFTAFMREGAAGMARQLSNADEEIAGANLPPIEAIQEVWASGVTYLRSRDARKAESSVADVYQKVYEAERPELFMKAIGWRVLTSGAPVHIRADSTWNVPEPELVLVINAHGEIIGYTAGNDMSSRDIEGENPLYLPQAKVYNGSCALGTEIVLCNADAMRDLPVSVDIERNGESVFAGETAINRMKRTLEELVAYLYKEYRFPHGAYLMTGTGIVPAESFTLDAGDVVTIKVGEVTMQNEVR